MKLEQKSEFTKLLTGVAELYGKGVSSCLFEIYWCSLEKYSLDEVKRAINLHIVNPDVGQFMPKPSDFIRYIEGKSEEKALFAWQKVIAAMKSVGAYESIAFDDPAIHYAIDKMGGWVVLCHSPESKSHYLFQDFSRNYFFCLTHRVSGCPKKLTGIFTNTGAHYHEKSTEIKFIENNTEKKSNA